MSPADASVRQSRSPRQRGGRATVAPEPTEGDWIEMPANTRRIAASAYESGLLDEINCRLLEELQDDARLSMAELGRRVSLSAPAVAERVQRLEEAGVITGYRVEVDPRAIGFPIGVIVRVRPNARQLHQIPDARPHDPRGRRVPSNHRRGLLLDPASPPLDRRPRGDHRPVPPVRTDDDVDHAVGADPAARAAAG